MLTKRNSLIGRLSRLPPDHVQRVLKALKPSHLRELNERWREWAHRGQRPTGDDWRVWMIMAGRGYGKTRAGAQWVHDLISADMVRTEEQRMLEPLRIALVGATADDVRKVMVEGVSGIIATAPTGCILDWRPTLGEITCKSGAILHIYSSQRPDKLRGPEHHFAWCDELASWLYADAMWDNLMLGLRLGGHARVLITTTPRAVPIIPRIKGMKGIEVRNGSTRKNVNLTPDFVEHVEQLYAGTRFGRQELDGELIDDLAGALWSRALIEDCRVAVPPALRRIVIGVDPSASVGGDACGIVAVGLGEDGVGYILGDHTVEGASPERWARAVADAADQWGADRVVAEANNGGAMVEAVLRGADVNMPVKRVHASRGKVVRAEPVLTLFESGKAAFAGAFPALEDELCGLITGGGYQGPGRSPDRADACVWALTELMLGPKERRVGVRVL